MDKTRLLIRLQWSLIPITSYCCKFPLVFSFQVCDEVNQKSRLAVGLYFWGDGVVLQVLVEYFFFGGGKNEAGNGVYGILFQ